MNRDPRQVLTEWLVLSAQNGSESAFTDLHDLWRADFRRLALIKIERPEAADEVMTDVWLSIARGLRRLNDPACFPRWAIQIVERRCADWIRRRSRERLQVRAIAEETKTQADIVRPDPDGPLEIQRLGDAIAGLPPDQRELLHLYYDLERSIGEIADALDVPPGTIKSRLFSVRENLRQVLERKNHE